MPAAGNIWLRLSAESGDKQIQPQDGEASVEYIDPEEVDGVKILRQDPSDLRRLSSTGMTDPSEVDSDIFKNGYYIVFTEYNSSMEDFIFDSNVVHGKNGETLLCNKQNGQGFFFNVVRNSGLQRNDGSRNNRNSHNSRAVGDRTGNNSRCSYIKARGIRRKAR